MLLFHRGLNEWLAAALAWIALTLGATTAQARCPTLAPVRRPPSSLEQRFDLKRDPPGIRGILLRTGRTARSVFKSRYAAIGSNLDAEQLKKRVASGDKKPPVPEKSGTIRGQRLVFVEARHFAKGLKRPTGGILALARNPESSVPVGLYRMTREQLRMLDRHEPNYNRKRMWVKDHDGAWQLAWVYALKFEDPTELPPSDQYWGVVTKGTVLWALPDTAIASARKSAIDMEASRAAQPARP